MLQQTINKLSATKHNNNAQRRYRDRQTNHKHEIHKKNTKPTLSRNITRVKWGNKNDI